MNMNSIVKDVIAEMMEPENLKEAERRGKLKSRFAGRSIRLFRQRQRHQQKKKN